MKGAKREMRKEERRNARQGVHAETRASSQLPAVQRQKTYIAWNDNDQWQRKCQVFPRQKDVALIRHDVSYGLPEAGVGLLLLWEMQLQVYLCVLFPIFTRVLVLQREIVKVENDRTRNQETVTSRSSLTHFWCEAFTTKDTPRYLKIYRTFSGSEG